MPPKFSKHGRTDHSASADMTPRGFRSPRGHRPQHTPRGGYQDRRQTRDTRTPEARSRVIDDAFGAPLDSVQPNSRVFAECISQVLRKQSGIKTKEDHDSALADSHFETMSRHLSYIFRHTKLMHRDGSLSLHELISHPGTARKNRALYREGRKFLQAFDQNELSMQVRRRENTVAFLMPLAHVICDSNKARAMIGYVTTEDFQPGIVPIPDTWFKPAEFDDEVTREGQADMLEGLDIASIFIRFESGHSTEVEIQHCPFQPEVFPLRYLIHGANEKNLESIRRLGLLPGGTRGGRNHVHFTLDSALSTIRDVLRPESDCILIARPGAVSGLGPVITHNRYVLTDQTVPFSRFCGVWSFVDRSWLVAPEPGELRRMNDYTSDIDLAMHVCHHQLYWEKKNENEQDGFTWSRSEYVEYVAEEIEKLPVVKKFLESFRNADSGPARPLRTDATPNDQELGPPETEADKRVKTLKAEISERFKKYLAKERNKEQSSASESEAPKGPVKAKPMPKKPKDAAAAASSDQACGNIDPNSEVDLQAASPWGGRRQVIKTKRRREMNAQAKDLFRDADAAQKFFTKFKKDTDEIQWFPRPAGPQCCKNFEDCGNSLIFSLLHIMELKTLIIQNMFMKCHFDVPSTGARVPKPDIEKNAESTVYQHDRPLASSLDFLDHSICEIDGDDDLAVSGVEACEVNLGADTHDVRRLMLAECRIAVFHISSYAWSNAYKETCQKWLQFVASCIEHQCDFLSGDGNLFAQRSFKADDHSDYRTCILIDILERFLQQINLHRSPINRITYNVVSSTTAADYIRSMRGDDADCDSMLLISLCYGKQIAVTEARAKEESASADGFAGSAFSDEVMLNDVEQLKHLMAYDLGLAEKDCAWHSPLLTYASLKALKNMRIRSKESEDKRREKWMQRTQGYLDKREERRDSVPPLRTDAHRNVGRTRSRSVSRTRAYRPRAETPAPPPAPVRAPAEKARPVQYKAAPRSLRETSAPKSSGSSSSARPPVKAPPVPAPGRTLGSQQPRTPPDPPGPPKTPPPWRERTQQADQRQRSQQADQRQTTRKRPINVPEPPAPPSRLSGSQWLSQGTASSSSGHRNYGYSYDQPSYYRVNPNTTQVEYVPGYQVPRQRWVQKYDGTWLDMIPQTPDQSIFFHLSGENRRQNELSFYGYYFTMGL